MAPQRGLPAARFVSDPRLCMAEREERGSSLTRNKPTRYVDNRTGGINVGPDKNSYVLTPRNKETKTGMCACGDAKRGKIPDMNV